MLFLADQDGAVVDDFIIKFVNVLQAFIPDFVERLDLLLAELHPLEELSTAGGLSHAHGVGSSVDLVIGGLFFRRLLVDLSLGRGTDGLGNLDNLAHVHARGEVGGVGEVEFSLSV